jgi:WD domain, G-beta repeat/CHAT domain
VTLDGRRLVSGASDRTLRVWDLETGRVVATLQGHAGRVKACAVTPDGRRLVSGSDDHTLKVWDLESGRPVATLQGHPGGAIACAVAPDGRRLVSGSADRTLKVWDLESGVCLLTHHASAAITAVAIAKTTIIAGDASGAVWFLDWPSPDHRYSSNCDDRRSEEPRNFSPNIKLPSPRPPMRHTILFLAANPLGTDRVALDREARDIQVELERSGQRDRFEFVTRWAAEPLDLLRELRKLKPTVVHFSGHGGPDADDGRRPGPAPRRDVAGGLGNSGDSPRHGLYLQGPNGQPQFVSTEALEQTFGAAGASVKLVVLNACYSDVQAQALLAHVGCIVGMNGSVRDDAARSFAIGFYGGLGERESIADAYKQGCAAVSLQGLPDRDRPQLSVRADVDASKLVLAADSVEPSASQAAPAPASQPSRPGPNKPAWTADPGGSMTNVSATRPTHAVFVIHADVPVETAFVRAELVPALRLEPNQIRFSSELPLGETIIGALENGVVSSRITILVLSPTLLRDTWAKFGESLAGYVAATGGTLVPLLLADCPLPPRLSLWVQLDCRDPQRRPDAFRRLRESLASIVSAPENARPPMTTQEALTDRDGPLPTSPVPAPRDAGNGQQHTIAVLRQIEHSPNAAIAHTMDTSLPTMGRMEFLSWAAQLLGVNHTGGGFYVTRARQDLELGIDAGATGRMRVHLFSKADWHVAWMRSLAATPGPMPTVAQPVFRQGSTRGSRYYYGFTWWHAGSSYVNEQAATSAFVQFLRTIALQQGISLA